MPAETNFVYAVSLVQKGNQGVINNVLHIRRDDATGALTSAELQAFANDFKASIIGRQHTSVNWDHWEAVQVAGPGTSYNASTCLLEGGIALVGAFTGALVGSNGGSDPLPAKDAMVVTLRTGFRGRSRRGRLYYGGLCEADQNDGSWTATALGLVGGTFDTFLAKYKSGGTDPKIRLVVFSRVIASGCKANRLALHHPLVHVQTGDQSDSWREVTEAVLRATVFSQRSRTSGKGA